MKILVTGGAGYIGSHTIVCLIKAGYEVVVVDNLINSKFEAIERIRHLSGVNIPFYKKDLTKAGSLTQVFHDHQFHAAIHFAGLKAVGESVDKPLIYYKNNLLSTINLCEKLSEYNVKRLIFSSSATVYGNPELLPIKEGSQTGLNITNPYGRSKHMIEQILMDIGASDSNWSIISLRYFNPIGADRSGLIGEDPNGTPNNLMPYILQVATGKQKFLKVFGDDYDTRDGTCVRDYIHVTDLAKGHLASLKIIQSVHGFNAYNLGTGKSVSVMETLNRFKKATGIEIPYRIVTRRAGDVASLYADVQKAKKELGWSAKLSFEQACKDSWKWQKNNPKGYTL